MLIGSQPKNIGLGSVVYIEAPPISVVFVNQVVVARARWLTTTRGARGGLSLTASPVFRVGTTLEGF